MGYLKKLLSFFLFSKISFSLEGRGRILYPIGSPEEKVPHLFEERPCFRKKPAFFEENPSQKEEEKIIDSMQRCFPDHYKKGFKPSSIVCLSLKGAGIKKLDPEIFLWNWPSLKKLDLKENGMQNVPGRFFSLAKKLQVVLLSHNPIVEISYTEAQWPKLKQLDLSFTLLVRFPKCLRLLPDNVSLLMRYNGIQLPATPPHLLEGINKRPEEKELSLKGLWKALRCVLYKDKSCSYVVRKILETKEKRLESFWKSIENTPPEKRNFLDEFFCKRIQEFLKIDNNYSIERAKKDLEYKKYEEEFLQGENAISKLKEHSENDEVSAGKYSICIGRLKKISALEHFFFQRIRDILRENGEPLEKPLWEILLFKKWKIIDFSGGFFSERISEIFRRYPHIVFGPRGALPALYYAMQNHEPCNELSWEKLGINPKDVAQFQHMLLSKECFSKVKTIALKKIGLYEIPKEISRSKFDSLISLDLRDNDIEFFPEEFFSTTKNLVMILLSNNKLSALPDSFPKGWTHLDLSANRFKKFPSILLENRGKPPATLVMRDNPLKKGAISEEAWGILADSKLFGDVDFRGVVSLMDIEKGYNSKILVG